MDFRQRNFQKPMVRLIQTMVRTKGSYTFEVFAYEGKKVRQFNVRFLPNKAYFAINFIKKTERIQLDSPQIESIATDVEKLFFEYRNEWEGKKSIQEMTFNFLTLLIDNQTIEVPDDVLNTLKGEINRIFKNTDVCKLDKKGRPYFSNAHFGKFFITDIGNIEPEDFERNGLKSN